MKDQGHYLGEDDRNVHYFWIAGERTTLRQMVVTVLLTVFAVVVLWAFGVYVIGGWG